MMPQDPRMIHSDHVWSCLKKWEVKQVLKLYFYKTKTRKESKLLAAAVAISDLAKRKYIHVYYIYTNFDITVLLGAQRTQFCRYLSQCSCVLTNQNFSNCRYYFEVTERKPLKHELCIAGHLELLLLLE